MEMSVEKAFRRAFETLMDWIDREVNLSKTQVLFRSYAPVHFRFVSLLIIFLRFLVIFTTPDKD